MNRKNNKVVAVSGYFNPLHVGHLEMIEMAKEQRKEAEAQLFDIEEKLKIALLPQDPNDDKNIFLEIRPAAG